MSKEELIIGFFEKGYCCDLDAIKDICLGLLKENQELKKQLEDANEKIILLQASEPMLNYKKSLEETQQKEFIKYLEDYINSLKKEYGNYVNDNYSEEYGRYYTAKETLQKYKEIIGADK